MTRRRLLVTLAAAGVLASPASAYELLRVDNNPCGNAQHVFWASRSAPVSTSSLPADLVQLANEARLRWNASVGGFEFRSGSGGECDTRDGVSTLAFSAVYCDGESLGDVLAVTRSRWNLRSGELLDADVTFNDAQPILRRSDDVFFEVALHELGHVLGLDHSDACGASGNGTLMKSVLSLSAPRLQWPTGDEIAGVNFIYPAEGSDGGLPEGANSCAIAAAPRRNGAVALVVGPLLLLVVRWRLARRTRWPGSTDSGRRLDASASPAAGGGG